MIAARSGRPVRGSESEAESHSMRDMRPVAIKITREINSDSTPGRVSSSKPTMLQDFEEALDDGEGEGDSEGERTQKGFSKLSQDGAPV